MKQDEQKTVAIVPAPIDAIDGAETPFGQRWGGEVVTLDAAHLDALGQGKTLAVDVMGEYVVFLRGERK